MTLLQAVNQFAEKNHCLTEDTLNNEDWAWQMYKQVRYAFLYTAQDLRHLAVDLLAKRLATGNPPTTAQQIMARHQAAYRAYVSRFIGLTDDDLDQEPAPEEWTLRTILEHVNIAEQAFFQVNRHAITQHMAGVTAPSFMPKEKMAHVRSEEIIAIFDGSLADNLAYYDTVHQQIINEMGNLNNDALEIPTVWWEETIFPVRFRMHRFEAHLREHTIQVEKTLMMLNKVPNEATRLLQDVYQALADVEGALIGTENFGVDEQTILAQTISSRAAELTALV
ncbi:MAG: DinB family protein [Chloroflexota bacterium]